MQHPIRVVVGVLASVCFLAALAPAALTAETGKPADSLVFGVFPHMPATRLFEVFSPVANDFSAHLGRPVKLRSKPDFTEFETELRAATYDIALIQPLDYPWVHELNGYLPLARRDAPLRTTILVNRESPISTIQDLRGKTLAQAAPRAAVTQISDAALVKAGFDLRKDIELSPSRNHFACMQKVLTRQADACATAQRALDHWEKAKVAGRFKVIYEAPHMPHALFVVHPRVPPVEREVLKKTILSWPDTGQGRALLAKGNLLPFVAAEDADYDPVRVFMAESAGLR